MAWAHCMRWVGASWAGSTCMSDPSQHLAARHCTWLLCTVIMHVIRGNTVVCYAIVQVCLIMLPRSKLSSSERRRWPEARTIIALAQLET